ncbi:hypothetical protein JIX59_10430 [Brevundimonas diminuta]|uniref:hypothetical protein n=1 Tax=Brevundimonas diminuta TaxID=293 RepID=UPI001908DD09|nr:hypothetical protein [Brevundimonas diminuta]MBK1969754.1 hypothetical protein [Brevundimonas diminuta]MDA0743211.1 hypothetical protein [Pseudomonadota bacterium]
MSAAEWTTFTAGKNPAGPDAQGWTIMTSVRHGTHLTSGVRIAQDGKIAADLIYDGKLANTRTRVVFLSPNSWHDGSRYGTLEFEMAWPGVLDGRTLYWVEALRNYAIPIHRFILSRRPPISGLTAYDPINDDGPIRLVGDQWFRVSDTACEILVDEDIPVDEIDAFSVTRHHERFCSQRRRPCEEAGGGFIRTSRRFQAALLGGGLTGLNRLMLRDGKLTGDAEHGTYALLLALGGQKGFMGVVTHPAQAMLVLRGALLLLAGGDQTGAADLARLLASANARDDLVRDMIRKHYDLPTWDWP